MSVISVLTPQDFKNLFIRDFNYLPVWLDTSTYNANNVVFYLPTNFFYVCLNNGITSIPNVDTANWQLQTPQNNQYNYILDTDITRAMNEANTMFNLSLWNTDANTVQGYLYLTAYYLVADMKAGGLGSSGTQLINAQSVGNVSQNFTIPDWVIKNPTYSMLWSNYYGQKYSMWIKNLIIGVAMFPTFGQTTI